MIEPVARIWVLAVALLAGCDGEQPAPVRNVAEPRPAATPPAATRPAAAPAPADAGRYTSLDPARCRLIEQNVEEGGYSRHACAGLGGFRLETSESDLRQDIVVIAPDGRRSELELSALVADGAFNSLGKTAEWRGPAARPAALIVRLNVAQGAEPTRPDISKLVVARLAPPACVVAVVPPGPGQNAAARAVADGRLPDCLEGGR